MRRMLQASWAWLDDRAGISDLLGPMMGHVVPRDARWWYVFGSATLCAFVVQIVTGLGLAMMYVSGGDQAYESLLYITNEAPIGRFLRGVHSYGASAMVLLAVIHLSQVFLHGAYKFPRELNWITGVVLLIFTLGIAFTGQLLRWDANGVWSVVVATEMAGRVPWIGEDLARFVLAGDTVNGGTLSRFFVFHTMVLPALIAGAAALHLRLILRHGISAMPKPGQAVDPVTYRETYEAELKRDGIPFWPYAAWRDALFSLLVVLGIVGCAWFLGPPALGGPPDPSDLNANPAPDWYFLSYFAILSMSPPSLETWIIVGGPVVLFGLLLVLPLLFNRGERAPSRRPWAIATVFVSWVALVILTIYGKQEPWSPDFAAKPLEASIVASTDPSVVRGAQLFHEKGCMYCHNISGFGGHRGPNLTEVGLRLTRPEMIIRINNGGHNMPSFAGVVDRTDLGTLLDFLATRRPVIRDSR